MSLKHDYTADFETFWNAYPRRVGKLAAQKAFIKVCRGGIGLEELLDGVTQYKATKPSYADWCHPTTWLNQGRWMDETTATVVDGGALCPHLPMCRSRHVCIERTLDEARAARSLR